MNRLKYDIAIVLALFIITFGYFFFTHTSVENDGIELYSKALSTYKQCDYEKAYEEFGKISSDSSIKLPALFRQARCASNIDKKDIAIKKYQKIIKSGAKSSIIPISQYNMAVLMYENGDKRAKKHFKLLIKNYPSSNYALGAEYYLGLIEKSQNRKNSKDKAIEHFLTYIEQAPDGRFAMNAVSEVILLKKNLTNSDNKLIGKVYYANGEYEKAQAYFSNTNLSETWADIARNEYRLGNKINANNYVEDGLKNHAVNVLSEDIYAVIDDYLLTFQNRKDGIGKLVSMQLNSNGADYVSYLNCNELVSGEYKEACYRTYYEKYPKGQFSADVLFNLFMNKYLQKRYLDAQKLGFQHIKYFSNAKSSPAVIFYMGKISQKFKHRENAVAYFKQVLKNYPDSYYAYRANCILHKEEGVLPFLTIIQKPVVFPYKKSLENNLVVKLAYLKDYDLVEELCKNDKFIQSWIAYEKGDYTISAVLARNAVDEMEIKPSFDDLRWRLVYPLHYYNIVDKFKLDNNPLIIQSIIKEESHFNPYAKSFAGATGLMQLMPLTYEEVVAKNNVPENLDDIQRNIYAGSLYYRNLKRRLFNKDLYAISAYNGGIGSVTGWFSKLIYNDTDEFVEQIPYPETRNYVKKVLRTYWMYGNIY